MAGYRSKGQQLELSVDMLRGSEHARAGYTCRCCRVQAPRAGCRRCKVAKKYEHHLLIALYLYECLAAFSRKQLLSLKLHALGKLATLCQYAVMYTTLKRRTVCPYAAPQIEMGSTNIRVGSTIFGAREYPNRAPAAAAAPKPDSPTSSG